jgi:hypothetical protein
MQASKMVVRLLLQVLVLVFANAVLQPAPSALAAAANPLARLLLQGGEGYLCFRRVYDDGHLQRYPGQLTTSALVSLDADKDNTGQTVWLKLQLHLQGWPSLANVGASCEWSAEANKNTSGSRLIPAYPRSDGFACIALYDNQAAEEAGTLMFDLAPDGRTMNVYLPDENIGLWGTVPEHTAPDKKTGVRSTVPGASPLRLGAQDRVFRLTRMLPAACNDMEKSIKLSKS